MISGRQYFNQWFSGKAQETEVKPAFPNLPTHHKAGFEDPATPGRNWSYAEVLSGRRS